MGMGQSLGVLWVIVILASALAGASARAEVAGLDHLQSVSVGNCKPDSEEKPRSSPAGKLCSYVHRLCDVAEGGKTILQSVYIDVDCLPRDSNSCPKISECAKDKLPEKLSDYVRGLNDPNNSGGRVDGAGFDELKKLGGAH